VFGIDSRVISTRVGPYPYQLSSEECVIFFRQDEHLDTSLGGEMS